VASLLAMPACDGGFTEPNPGKGVAAAEQASWSIRAYPAGLLAPLRKKEKARLRDQRKKLSSILREVYDALFFHPGGARRVLRRWFTARSARALLRSRVGPPSGTELLRTTKRVAVIGIDASSARRAAARVRLQARLLKDDRWLRIRHLSTLWFERSGGGWEIIAFDVDQEQVR
jgi:hypothetical protein